MNSNSQRSGGQDSIVNELKSIKETLRRCCCSLLSKEWTVDCECNCNCNCECQGGGGGGQCLCIAKSVCNKDNDGVASVTVPANSCITKIYASFVQEKGDAKYALVEANSGATAFFCHRFIEQSAQGGAFDTTLVQPICVGTEDVTVSVTAYKANGTIQDDALVTLTVVYCEDCCTPVE